MTKRIVVTGWGCLSAVGNSVAETWNAIKTGSSGIDKISTWDASEWEYPLGAQIKNLDPKQYIDRKLLKLLSQHDVLGLGAVDQAVRHSELLSYRESLADPTDFNERTGVYVASPGSKFYQQYDFFPLLTQSKGCLKQFGEDLSSIVHPMWLLRTLPNNVLAYTGIQYGFKGANQNIINHSVGGAQAILEASYAIREGVIDRAVVSGYDMMTDPQTQTYYAALGVLTKQKLKPFDESRDGTVLGEGSGSLILETLDSAKERGATIYGEILDGASVAEAMGIFAIREDGEGLASALAQTLQRAELNSQDIGMITAHGNGTIVSDAVEAKVYSELFSNIPITGFKWALGHTFAAAGVIETILTFLSLQEKQVPGISTFQEKAQDCAGINVNKISQALKKPIAVVVTRGFASISTCVALTSFIE